MSDLYFPTRYPFSGACVANVRSVQLPAIPGRMDIINPDPTNQLFMSFDASPTGGAAANGVHPIGANGGALSILGCGGQTVYFWSANATANVTCNFWSN